jgi:tetratricopeptide (TPR) repeat protein
LKDQGRSAQIASHIEAYLQNKLPKASDQAQQAVLLSAVADLYASLGFSDAAYDHYQKGLQADANIYPTVAMRLAGQGRHAEAVQLCFKATSWDMTPRAAMTLGTVLTIGRPTPDDRRAAEPILQLALAKHDKHEALLFSIATLRLIEGRNEDAIRLLRNILEINPRNLQALNNLAMVLSQSRDGCPEALTHIDRALTIAGRNAELLDSKGWILLKYGKPDEAAALFREALSVPQADPRHHLHLAVTYHVLGKLPEAKQSLDKARDLKLSMNLLTPDERSHLARLEAAVQ